MDQVLKGDTVASAPFQYFADYQEPETRSIPKIAVRDLVDPTSMLSEVPKLIGLTHAAPFDFMRGGQPIPEPSV